jgi:hypothetical protein
MTLISASFHTLINPFPFLLIQAQLGFQVSFGTKEFVAVAELWYDQYKASYQVGSLG